MTQPMSEVGKEARSGHSHPRDCQATMNGSDSRPVLESYSAEKTTALPFPKQLRVLKKVVFVSGGWQQREKRPAIMSHRITDE